MEHDMRPGLIARVLVPTAAVMLIGTATGVPQSAPSAAAAPLPSNPASAGTRLNTIPEATGVRYLLRAQAIGQAPEDVICTTNAITGSLVMGPEGAVVPDQSKFIIDQRTMECNSPRATSLVQKTLDTAAHPMSEYTVRETPGLPVPLPGAGDGAFQFVGDQRGRTTTRPMTYEVTSTFNEAGMAGVAVAHTRLSDYGLKPPGLGPLLKVDDNFVVEISFQVAAADAGF
jgi:hypothetical protein